jgi:hypothetical protein
MAKAQDRPIADSPSRDVVEFEMDCLGGQVDGRQR